MRQLSTHEFTKRLFLPVFRSFREIRRPEDLQRILPFKLVPAVDISAKLGLVDELPDDFMETSFHIKDGDNVIATIDTAFKLNKGIVNYSFLIQPRELFKQRAAKKVYSKLIIPYLRQETGCSNWREQLSRIYYLIIEERDLVVQAKFYPENHRTYGLAIMELRYSGLQ